MKNHLGYTHLGRGPVNLLHRLNFQISHDQLAESRSLGSGGKSGSASAGARGASSSASAALLAADLGEGGTEEYKPNVSAVDTSYRYVRSFPFNLVLHLLSGSN